MNMNIASYPGRARHDELVPSRYALRVGEIDVLVISDGVLPLPAATLATNAKRADLSAWLDYRLLPPDVFTWPLNAIVVRSGGQTVLVDAGVGDAFPSFRAGLLAQRMRAAGIDPASVTGVVITTRELLVAAHLPFPSVGRVAVDGKGFRWVPGIWDY